MLRGREFDRDRPFVAQTAFLFEDRLYQPGDAFPWRALGVSERKLYTLWATRRVWHGERQATEPAAPPPIDPVPPTAKAKPRRDRASAGA